MRMFETKSSLQSLVDTLRKHKVELVVDINSEKRKKENIAPADKITN